MIDKEHILKILKKNKVAIRKTFKRKYLYTNGEIAIINDKRIYHYSNIDLEYACSTYIFDDNGQLIDIELSGWY